MSASFLHHVCLIPSGLIPFLMRPLILLHRRGNSVSVVAQYNASQLITQREAVSRELRKALTQRAATFNIVLDDVSIASLTFGKEFTAAIEAKQVAAQEADGAKFVVEKAEQEKQSAIIRAQVRLRFPCVSEYENGLTPSLDISSMNMHGSLVLLSLMMCYFCCQLKTSAFSVWVVGRGRECQADGQSIANNPEFITSRKIEAAREVAHMLANPANKDLQLRIEAAREIVRLVNNFATKQVRNEGLTITACLSFVELYSMVKEGFVKDAEKAKAIQEARFQAFLQLGREAVDEIAGLGQEICSLKEHIVQADKLVLVVHEVQRK
ncbi:hypothetical protein C3L33_21198, partial [Rhododendron williamsianum]